VLRIVSEKLSKIWNQPVTVVNRPGGNGFVAVDATQRAAPDGYTIGLASVGALAIAPTLYARLPFDPNRDFSYVSGMYQLPNLLVINNDVPARTVPELIALLRANPGRYAYASSGSGTTVHLSGEMFKYLANLDILHVPYRGGAPAHIDLLGGRVHMIFDNIPQALQLAREGKVRALAVTGASRSPQAPEIPTMSEFLPGFEITSWGGVRGPAGISPAIVARMNALTRQALESPDLIRRLAENGGTPWYTSAAEFIRFRAANEAGFAPLIRASGARVE
jgi:tripartite-type tricarboxylate transporter receptor subunit TctC